MDEELIIVDGRKTNFIIKDHLYIDFWLPFLVSHQSGVNDLYDILLRLINNKKGHPLQDHAWPSYSTLQKRMGKVGRSKVSRCLKLLSDYGLIKIEKATDQNQNIYTILDVPSPTVEIYKFLEIDFQEEKKKINREMMARMPKTPVKKQKPEGEIVRKTKNNPQELLKFWRREYERILQISPATYNATETKKYLSQFKSLLTAYNGDKELIEKMITFFILNYTNISGYTSESPSIGGLAGFKEAIVFKMSKQKQSGRKEHEL